MLLEFFFFGGGMRMIWIHVLCCLKMVKVFLNFLKSLYMNSLFIFRFSKLEMCVKREIFFNKITLPKITTLRVIVLFTFLFQFEPNIKTEKFSTLHV